VSAIVLDASVAVALVIDEPGSRAAAEATFGHDPLVPEAFWVEVSNALVRKVRQGFSTRDEAFAAFGLLRRLVEYSVPTEPLGAFAMALSLDLDHTVYDCLYLAAAVAHEAPLLTADRALYVKALDAGYGEHVHLVG
jgi:predicted nucleic acid-binding protein